MKTILDQIKINKLKEVEKRKQLQPTKILESSSLFSRVCKSFSKAILDPSKKGLICEFKRQSPSKGVINSNADIKDYVEIYQQNGASALSVLNDQLFFGAKVDDFTMACKYATIPILQKDFIVDPYQIIEAKSLGADAILLIAKMLTPSQVKSYTELAKQVGLQVLLETQNKQEIELFAHLPIELIGINNRNLNNFEVNIQNSIDLAGLLPKNTIRIAESGLDSPDVINQLKDNGFQGFLIGEYFMKQGNPKTALEELILNLK
ncbi:indole-3-glycerol phosphate synthase TrpC [Myroides sp. LJL110]